MEESQGLREQSIIVRRRDAIAAEIDGEIMLTGEKEGEFYRLDPVGTRIWELISQPVSVSELCSTLEDEFQVDPAMCQRDVLRFLNGLMKSKLIEHVDPPAI